MTTPPAGPSDQGSTPKGDRTRLPRPAGDPNTEDPILAAMGVGASASSEPNLEAPLTRSVTSGPGERAEPVKRRWRTG